MEYELVLKSGKLVAPGSTPPPDNEKTPLTRPRTRAVLAEIDHRVHADLVGVLHGQVALVDRPRRPLAPEPGVAFGEAGELDVEGRLQRQRSERRLTEAEGLRKRETRGGRRSTGGADLRA